MLDFAKIPDEMLKNWEILAEKTAQYEFLDQMTKVMLAKYASLSNWKSESEKERLARNNPDFEKHLESVKIERHEMLKAKTKQEALSARFEYYRSCNANERAQINLR